jgi:hypothetical protein
MLGDPFIAGYISPIQTNRLYKPYPNKQAKFVPVLKSLNLRYKEKKVQQMCGSSSSRLMQSDFLWTC